MSIGLVGAGAMGRALAAGLVAGHPGMERELLLSDAVPEAARAAADELGARAVVVDQLAQCEVVCLAVKPADVAGALAGLAPVLRDDAVLISVVAGWDLERLRQALPGRAVVRTMPNLAVRYGCGVVAHTTEGIDRDQVARVATLLAPLGAVVALPERLFGAATALAGSGPGLVALVAEALEEGAVGCGLGRGQARDMVRAVLAGTAALLDDGTDPATLRQRVSSPAGTTLEGLAVLERGAVRAHLADAVRAAARRAEEL